MSIIWPQYIDPQTPLTRAQRRDIRLRALQLLTRPDNLLVSTVLAGLPVMVVALQWRLSVTGLPGPWPVVASSLVALLVGWRCQKILWTRLARASRKAVRDYGIEVCLHCGYWLRALYETEYCPECGQDRLPHNPPQD